MMRPTPVRVLVPVVAGCCAALCVALALQYPAPVATPTGSVLPDPLTDVRPFLEAISTKNAQVAGALWAGDAFLQAQAGFACDHGCQGRDAIEASLIANWFPYRPITAVIEQTSGSTVLERGQGTVSGVGDFFYAASYEVGDGLIQRGEFGGFTTGASALVGAVVVGR